MAPELTGAVWRKSSRSGGTNGNCVEVTHVGESHAVRDSKNQTGPVLLVDLSGLFEAMKAGRSTS